MHRVGSAECVQARKFPGSGVDPEHLASLTAALLTGKELEVTEPGESEDYGQDWGDCRALGERGTLAAVAGVVVARPPASRPGEARPDVAARAEWRAAQRNAVIEQINAYNPEAVVCVGPPFGHTRPQWILPYGGKVTLDGEQRRLMANYW